MEPVPVQPKLLKRFYEALVMLRVLGRNRGDRIKADDSPSDHEDQSLRRKFIRNLAYLCDFEKGGHSVTAIALQQTPQKIVYWFASNKTPDAKSGAKDRTRSFLQDIIGALRNAIPGTAAETESELFTKSVKFSSKRISEYVKILTKELSSVLSDPSALHPDRDESFTTWLRTIKASVGQPELLCRMCYDISPETYRTLLLKSASGQPCASRFETIRYNIGRLNHTMKAVKALITASLTLPYLFDDVEIARVGSGTRSPPPLRDRNPTLEAIAGRMTSNPAAIASLRESLRDLDQKFNLSSKLTAECKSPNWRPRVHAELILLDKFWMEDLEFVDGDRYIGCSKPACYCCYHYIVAHPGRFVVPASHNNTYIDWKAPDIYDAENQVLIKNREAILNGMAMKIRNEVEGQILEKRGPARWRPDSLTEISTVRMGMLDGLSTSSMSSDSEGSEDGSCGEEESNFEQKEKERSTQESGTESQDGEVGSDGEKVENESREKGPDFELNDKEGSKQEIESESEDEEAGGAPLVTCREG